MPKYPVMRLFGQVGTVTLEKQGLYYAFRACVRPFGDGFCRLYHHTHAGSVRLGLFDRQGACNGRISLRQLCPEEGVFSVTEEPWLPLKEPLDGGLMPPGILCRREGEGRLVVLPDGPELPPEILPFFCFLTPKSIEGLPCLALVADRQGRPVVPDLSLR